MNKTSTILGVIIVVLLVIGGMVYFSKPSTTGSDQTPTDANGNVTAGASNNTTNTSQTPQPTQPNQAVIRVAGAPTVTTGVTSFPTDTTVTITGGVTPNGASTDYWFEYGTTANLGSKTSSQNVGGGYILIPTPANFTGLKANTTYYYQLVAQNQYGVSKGAKLSFKTTTGTPARVGSKPVIRTVAATGLARTAANLNGAVDPNSNTTYYWFEYGKTNKLGDTSIMASVGAGTASKSVSHLASGLEPGTTYYFRINAQNDFGTVNGKILSFKTPVK